MRLVGFASALVCALRVAMATSAQWPAIDSQDGGWTPLVPSSRSDRETPGSPQKPRNANKISAASGNTATNGTAAKGVEELPKPEKFLSRLFGFSRPAAPPPPPRPAPPMYDYSGFRSREVLPPHKRRINSRYPSLMNNYYRDPPRRVVNKGYNNYDYFDYDYSVSPWKKSSSEEDDASFIHTSSRPTSKPHYIRPRPKTTPGYRLHPNARPKIPQESLIPQTGYKQYHQSYPQLNSIFNPSNVNSLFNVLNPLSYIPVRTYQPSFTGRGIPKYPLTVDRPHYHRPTLTKNRYKRPGQAVYTNFGDDPVSDSPHHPDVQNYIKAPPSFRKPNVRKPIWPTFKPRPNYRQPHFSSEIQKEVINEGEPGNTFNPEDIVIDYEFQDTPSHEMPYSFDKDFPLRDDLYVGKDGNIYIKDDQPDTNSITDSSDLNLYGFGDKNPPSDHQTPKLEPNFNEETYQDLLRNHQMVPGQSPREGYKELTSLRSFPQSYGMPTLKPPPPRPNRTTQSPDHGMHYDSGRPRAAFQIPKYNFQGNLQDQATPSKGKTGFFPGNGFFNADLETVMMMSPSERRYLTKR